MNLLGKMPFICVLLPFTFTTLSFMGNHFLFYLLESDDFLRITPFTSTYRVEDVLSDDVSEWACGFSRHVAPSNHHAHCCHPHAHSQELARPRVSVWCERVQAGQWDLNRSKCFWSKIPGKKKQLLNYNQESITVILQRDCLGIQYSNCKKNIL